MFPTGVSPGEAPRIKDSAMGELINSLTTVASQSLRHLHLAHFKIHSDRNAEALGTLLCRKAVLLETISLE